MGTTGKSKLELRKARVQKDVEDVKKPKKAKEKIMTAPPIHAGQVEIQVDARTKVFGRRSSITLWKLRSPYAAIVAHYVAGEDGAVTRVPGPPPVEKKVEKGQGKFAKAA